ncbi:MAG: GNAT family N-acetyltransferase [Deltaproteobacteria bacterium]|nr:GNAT family N-acetyltransferase [Deltaproteobacteria bacterium]
MRLRQARGEGELDRVRALFVDYEQELGVDLRFQDFEAELASLPGRYAPPAGGLLLAWEGDQAVGVVGMRSIDQGRCEMKRLYVSPAWRGQGIGRELSEAVVSEARRAGYLAMRLDTLGRLGEALALYRSMGFREIPPYRENPLEDAVFLELEFGGTEKSRG